MPDIRKLDPSLVNKIAAGEVIERPASVVKELVENAIDAGATQIDVTLEEGGAGLIRVSDNGGGIPGPQLALAVEPHATSKIATSDDLFRIQTMGFRGEALASIASVSHFRITSRTADQLEAYTIALPTGPQDAGSTVSTLQAPSLKPQSCSGPVGSSVEVRNLFYNVPARRKFLRQAATELANASEQLARLSLAHPHIAFTLTHNGRQSRNLPPTTDRRSRISDFYGPELAAGLMPIDRNERGLRIEALIAPPAQSRASTKWQYLFLNGRFISDRRIAYALREAFRGLVEHDRYPVAFLFLTAPWDSYDVNVHPTKIEVRWRDAGLVQSQVLAVLRETLLSHDFFPPLRFDRTSAGPAAGGDDARLAGTRQALADYLRSIDPTQARIRFDPPRFSPSNLRPSIATAYVPPPIRPAVAPTVDRLGERFVGDSTFDEAVARGRDSFEPPTVADGDDLKSEISNPSPPGLDSPNEAVDSSASALSELSALSVLQVHNTYIVAQTQEGMVIIDQHALHERILYEQFRRRVLAGPLESQRLLIPATLEAGAARAQAAEAQAALLQRLGIEVSAFGRGVLAVQAFPTLLPGVDIPSFTGDLLDRLAEEGQTHSEETLIHAALDMMACKAAVKAGDALSAEEMHALLSQRHLTEKSSNCPHGRPTTLQLTTRDLEKQFKRV